ncbi:S-adenosyl-L-methionine-dependent methyltransferase [Pilatotrama ljubarskyi]|nr:S-adenosyl-L-methionine-dependent methyltransferase [Pilatotrama ljubarskyi]
MFSVARTRLARSPPVRRRALASVSSSSINPNSVGPFQVFDRNAKRLQRDRAAARDGGTRSRTVDYVRDEIADRMIERFQDIKRKFNTVLDLGSGPGHFSKLLDPEMTQKATLLDSSEKLLNRDPDSDFEVEIERIHADEENLIRVIPRNSQEAIVSCLSLHWVNDLPGVLVQIKEALKPDGVFLGALFGGDTLFELRTSLQLAEVEREGGISPHVSPMTGATQTSWTSATADHTGFVIDSRDMSNLLGRAGFTLLTVDVDEVKVAYPSMWELMEDLQDMGESNAVVGRRHFIHRDTLAAASAIYKELHGQEDGSVPATFQVIYVIGWKPAPNQPKPLERGSAQTNLKDVL